MTSDFFQLNEASPTIPNGLASFGNRLYAVGLGIEPPSGNGNNGSTDYWIVRRSTDRGNTWATVDQLKFARANGVAVDPKSGAIYVSGIRTETIGPSWLVRKSTDGGNSWSTIDNSIDGDATRVAVDPRGSVSVVGSGGSMGTGILRRSTDGGSTWTQMDYSGGRQQFPQAIAAGPSGELFIGGGTQNSTPEVFNRQWTIWYSPNGTTGWQQVDSYPGPISGNFNDTFPNHGVVSSVDGRVVFVGNSNGSWLARQASLANPTQWSILDSYTPEPTAKGTEAAAFAVVLRPFGEAFVIGKQTASYNGSLYSTLLTRRGNPPLEPFNWTDLLYEAGVTAGIPVTPELLGTGVAAETGRGDVLVGGAITVPVGGGQTQAWIVRKLGCVGR